MEQWKNPELIFFSSPKLLKASIAGTRYILLIPVKVMITEELVMKELGLVKISKKLIQFQFVGSGVSRRTSIQRGGVRNLFTNKFPGIFSRQAFGRARLLQHW